MLTDRQTHRETDAPITIQLLMYREEVMRTRSDPSASTAPLRDHTRRGVGLPRRARHLSSSR